MSLCEIDGVRSVMSITMDAIRSRIGADPCEALAGAADRAPAVREKKLPVSVKRPAAIKRLRDSYRACSTVAPTATPIAMAPAAAAIATAGVSEKDRLYHGSVTAGAAVGSASMIRS